MQTCRLGKVQITQLQPFVASTGAACLCWQLLVYTSLFFHAVENVHPMLQSSVPLTARLCFMRQSSSPEPAADDATGKISRQPRSVHSIGREATRLAELVASREGQRIRDGEDKRNHWLPLAFDPTPLLHTSHNFL